jgi:hypothetical protein
MKIKYYFILLAVFFTFLQNCSSSKVLDSWKAEPSIVDLFKTKKVLVIARAANDNARYTFEKEIADALRERGINASESYHLAPKIYPHTEISEERMAFIKSIMDSEGYNAVVLTVVKDKKQTVRTSSSGIYVGASYSAYYPGYYGAFYNYYSYPYAYGSYYNSFGGYIPTSTSTSVSTDYVLETVAYNLDKSDDNQLVAVVTSSLEDPKESHKTAEKYVALLVNALAEKK